MRRRATIDETTPAGPKMQSAPLQELNEGYGLPKEGTPDV